jgi:hypothetical protein
MSSSSSGGGENDSSRGPRRIVESLSDLAEALEESVEVKDRRYRLKVYKKAFLGTDACDCLYEFLQQIDESFTRQHAIQCGRYIATKYRMFEHVCNDHILQDDYLMYRFTPQSERQVPTKEDEENDRDYFTRLLENDQNLIVEDQLQVESSQEMHALAFMADMIAPSEDSGSTTRNTKRSWRRPAGRTAKDKAILSPSSTHSKSSVSSSRGSPSLDGEESIISVGDIDGVDDLDAIVFAFVTGVEAKTNRYRGKAYKKTFVGTDAVAFLASYLGVKRSAALQIGNLLMSRFNLFEHVTKDHGKNIFNSLWWCVVACFSQWCSFVANTK